MRNLLEQQRKNCFEALGNLPKNLQHAYYSRIMSAEIPDYKQRHVKATFFVLGVALGVLVTALVFAL